MRINSVRTNKETLKLHKISVVIWDSKCSRDIRKFSEISMNTLDVVLSKINVWISHTELTKLHRIKLTYFYYRFHQKGYFLAKHKEFMTYINAPYIRWNVFYHIWSRQKIILVLRCVRIQSVKGSYNIGSFDS